MKKAFTIVESLITIGIIGIIVALTLPTIGHLRPDKIKIKYLNAYDALQQSVLSFASNTEEYPICGDIDGNNTLFSSFENNINAPLMNINNAIANSVSQGNSFSGNSKLCRLVAWGMDATVNNDSLDATVGGNPPNAALTNCFTTPNGIDWYMFVRNFVANGNNSNFSENVMIDINGNEQPNCSYGNNCTNPDRFWFMITADGSVFPADPMGKAYIETRKTLSYRDMTRYINNNNLIYSTWTDGDTAGANEVSSRVRLSSCN